MNRELKVETLFYGVGKYSSILLTLITTSILSHILSPEEYGIVAVTSVFTAFFNVVADMGFGTAVIQNKTLTDDEINDIFSFSVYISIGLGLLFALLGFPIAVFYQNSVYREICGLLGISVFFYALNIIPSGIMMKNKYFKLVGKRLICCTLISGAVTIGLACAGWSYYALVAQSILYAAMVAAWNLWHTKLKFCFRIRMASIRKVRSYSLYQFAYSLVNYGENNFDNLLISKALGSESLAYYDKGYRLMMYPVQNLTYVITPVIHPVLSEHQNDRRYIYEAYQKIVRVLSLLGVFISAVCFWNSREIILLFFGNQWEISVPIFRVLSLAVWPQLVVSSARSIYQSTGNTRLLFISSVLRFAIVAVLVTAGALTGELLYVSCAITFSMYLRFFLDYYILVKRNFGYSFWHFLAGFRFEAMIFALMGAVITVLRSISMENLLLSLLCKGCILLIVFLTSSTIFGQLNPLIELLKKKRGRG